MNHLETKLTTVNSWNPIVINAVKPIEVEKSRRQVKTCVHCKRKGHDEPRCWKKHPRLRRKKEF